MIQDLDDPDHDYKQEDFGNNKRPGEFKREAEQLMEIEQPDDSVHSLDINNILGYKKQKNPQQLDLVYHEDED